MTIPAICKGICFIWIPGSLHLACSCLSPLLLCSLQWKKTIHHRHKHFTAQSTAMSRLGICCTLQFIISYFNTLLFLSFWWLELSIILSDSLPSGTRSCSIFTSSLGCSDAEGPFGSQKRPLFPHALMVRYARMCFQENDQIWQEKRAELPALLATIAGDNVSKKRETAKDESCFSED